LRVVAHEFLPNRTVSESSKNNLAELKQKGILSEEEFAAKKAELLARL
jgi:hypothetical protein